MFWLLFISAILAVVAQGQVNNCTFKYYTVNTYQDQNSFKFVCYGVGSDCEVYYTPPGRGCTGDSLLLIGTVSENETQVFTSDFELGSGFCSNNQIGVYYAENSGSIKAHLPRATEAGTKFNIPIAIIGGPDEYTCQMFTFSSPTDFDIFYSDIGIAGTTDPFYYEIFEFTVNSTSDYVVRMKSDNPVIVSCIGLIAGFATFQPISPEPLLITAYGIHLLAVVISDCSTNELITDFSKVKVTYEPYETGSICDPTRDDTNEVQIFQVPFVTIGTSVSCVYFVEPLDNLCVSTSVLKDANIVDVGLPESRFSTRFVKNADVDEARLFSFSETTCTGFGDDSEEQSVNLTSLGQDLSGKVSFGDWPATSQFSRVECANPILLTAAEVSSLIPYLSGYQPDELWQPFFEPQCIDSQSLTPALTDAPIEAPTDAPTEAPIDAPTEAPTDAPTEAPTNAPTEALTNAPTGNIPAPPSPSDARSLVSCISWVAFFGLHLFSSSLV